MHHDAVFATQSTEPSNNEKINNLEPTLIVYGYRLENSEKDARFSDNGMPQLRVGSSGVLRLFGSGWTKNTYFTFTSRIGEKGEHCEFPIEDTFKVIC